MYFMPLEMLASRAPQARQRFIPMREGIIRAMPSPRAMAGARTLDERLAQARSGTNPGPSARQSALSAASSEGNRPAPTVGRAKRDRSSSVYCHGTKLAMALWCLHRDTITDLTARTFLRAKPGCWSTGFGAGIRFAFHKYVGGGRRRRRGVLLCACPGDGKRGVLEPQPSTGAGGRSPDTSPGRWTDHPSASAGPGCGEAERPRTALVGELT